MEASHGRALSSNVSEIEEEAPAMEEEDVIYVAVPAEYKAGKSAFFWAIQNTSRDQPIVLAHVHTPAQLIPMRMPPSLPLACGLILEFTLQCYVFLKGFLPLDLGSGEIPCRIPTVTISLQFPPSMKGFFLGGGKGFIFMGPLK